jgi:phytoene desaturase
VVISPAIKLNLPNTNNSVKIGVIGAGFAGLSAAACLAKAGFDVTVFEKNESAGGRARTFVSQGFQFDMGPSWYWMPDVFEKFFSRFGKKPSDYYSLVRLDPSYRVFYSRKEIIDIPAGIEAVSNLFEQLQPGSGERLMKFLKDGKIKYETAMKAGLAYAPGISLSELINVNFIKAIFSLHVFQSLSTYIKKQFTHQKLIQLLEFPALFLGAHAVTIPALYSLMNYADIALGTWYPMGGMHKIIEGMVSVGHEHGVKFEFNSDVDNLVVRESLITHVGINGNSKAFDYVVAAADYPFVESLLPKSLRNYSEQYWNKKALTPSCLIFFLGINKKLKNLQHHNLFFDRDFDRHAHEMFNKPCWPQDPLFYVCCPSLSDPGAAPPAHENIFVLMPVAPGLNDEESSRQRYFDAIIDRLEKLTGQTILDSIVVKRSYAHRDFMDDYHAFRGNAFGLASTLSQTAHLRASIRNKRIKNLFYAGQYTVPGPGVPPAIISGQVVADELIKRVKSDRLRVI